MLLLRDKFLDISIPLDKEQKIELELIIKNNCACSIYNEHAFAPLEQVLLTLFSKAKQLELFKEIESVVKTEIKKHIKGGLAYERSMPYLGIPTLLSDTGYYVPTITVNEDGIVRHNMLKTAVKLATTAELPKFVTREQAVALDLKISDTLLERNDIFSLSTEKDASLDLSFAANLKTVGQTYWFISSFFILDELNHVSFVHRQYMPRHYVQLYTETRDFWAMVKQIFVDHNLTPPDIKQLTFNKFNNPIFYLDDSKVLSCLEDTVYCLADFKPKPLTEKTLMIIDDVLNKYYDELAVAYSDTTFAVSCKRPIKELDNTQFLMLPRLPLFMHLDAKAERLEYSVTELEFNYAVDLGNVPVVSLPGGYRYIKAVDYFKNKTDLKPQEGIIRRMNARVIPK